MSPTNKAERYLIQVRLPLKAEQARFEALVAASGLSKSDYVRQCCLDTVPTVVPGPNLQLYSQMGQLQIILKRAAQKADLPELATALGQLQTMRLALVGLLEETENGTLPPE